MHFYHPEFLYGLFAIAIPIIIHLFNFKRFKKVYFTNVRFLRNVQQQSKRHSQWRHLLVLLLRVLVVAFIVLAFARPYLPVKGNRNTDQSLINNVTVFLDNSFSMQAESAEGNLLEEGRKKAREIVMAYNPTDNFRLLLNNPIPESNRFLNRDAFLELLDEVHIEPSSIPFSSVLNRVSNFDLQGRQSNQEVYLVSDFQKSQADMNHWSVDTTLQINLIPLSSASQDNIFIDSCWFETPVLQAKKTLVLNYRIKNLSDQVVEKLPISLTVSAKQKAIASVDLKAFEERNEKLVFQMDTAGVFHAKIAIRDYPITYDDQFYFGFTIVKQIRVLSIQGADYANAVSLFYKGDSLFDFVEQPVNRVNYSSLKSFNVIILNGIKQYSSGLLMELQKVSRQNVSIVIIPSLAIGSGDVRSLQKAFKMDAFLTVDTAKASLRWMDIESEEFNDVFDVEGGQFRLADNVDMPFFNKHWVLQTWNQSRALDLIKFDNGNSFLRKYHFQQSVIYLFTAPFTNGASNISSHALFVPIMYNVAMQSKQQSNLYYTLGQENSISLMTTTNDDNDAVYYVKAVEGNFQFIPAINRRGANPSIIIDANAITDAGNYSILKSGREIQSAAFNYSRIESDLHSYHTNELKQIVKNMGVNNINILSSENAPITTVVKDLHSGVQLWKLFLSLAVLLLIIELFLLRFMK